MFTKEKLENSKFLFREITKQIFEISLISYLFFYLLDQFFKQLVSSYINLNIFLIIIFSSGIILNLFKIKTEEKKPANKVRDYLFIFILGLAATIFIYLKLEATFWIKIFSAIIGGTIIVLLTKILLSNENDR